MAGPIQYIPRLAPGLQLRAAEQPGQHRILRGDGKALRMPDRFVGMLLCFDGARSVRAIAEALSLGDGPDVHAALIDKLARQMVAQGVVELVPVAREVERLGAPRQDCRMCGASCENSIVGPLPDARVEQILRDHARLVERHPRLAHLEPIQETPIGLALGHVDGRCVFLDPDDRLCLLHKHFGPESKPITCQSFPISVIETEDAIRVGLQPTCMTLHETWLDGAPVTLERVPHDDLGYRPPSPTPSLPTGPLSHPAATPLEEERALLSWLDEPLPLPELLARVAGAPPQMPGREALTEAARDAIASRLTRFARGRLAELQAYDFDTLHHAQALALFSRLTALDAPPTRPELPESHARFVRFCVQQGLFVRETGRLPSPRLGALMLTLGGLIAAWVAPPEAGEAIGDDFARAMVSWNREALFGQALPELFPDPESTERFFATLRR